MAERVGKRDQGQRPPRLASVRIDSGPIDAELYLRDVPKEGWPQLVKERRYFLSRNLGHDCRCLVRFIREAGEMWESLGYPSRDALILDGYDLEPEEINLAVRWLELNDPAEAIGLGEVITAATASERGKAAAEATTGEVLPADGFVAARDEQGRQIADPVGSQSARARQAGVSPRTQRNLDALARRRPDLLGQVQRKEMSTHRACIEAGIVKVKPPLEQAQALCARLSPEERQELLAWLQAQGQE